ncbi:phosphoenolpyruvate--protein phosphotransferase [Photobacterium japonica]|uniref:phosphoenolpyruvate--protein phosphotransferase n=1 Tax=Photobacterium japonica TaxID=2910235 RepID=UPI003D0A5898
MKHELSFRCALPNGIHARPAGHLEKACQPFQCQITLINHRNGNRGNAKSVLALVGTDTLLHDDCTLLFDGADSTEALATLQHYITDVFPYCDEALALASEDDAVVLPQSLTRLTPTLLHGTRLAHGIGHGTLVNFQHVDLVRFSTAAQGDEYARFTDAHQTVNANLTQAIAQANAHEKAILDAHLAMLQDSTLVDGVTALLATHSTADAILAIVEQLSAQLQQSASVYLRERVLDIRDVATQLLMAAYPHVTCQREFALTEPSLVIASDLTPSQFLGLDKTLLQGLILTQAGSTSHTVILARAFNIPTLSGIALSECMNALNTPVYIDTQLGIMAIQANEGVQRYFNRALLLKKQQQTRQHAFALQPARTQDGHSLEVAANIASTLEAEAAFNQGAEGIGLFRTEMLFMDRPQAPNENEQVQHYRDVLQAANGKPVIIRTMDIGGDKPIEYLNLPEENNPFLGYRAVRIYPQFLPLFHTQLRAILRASVHGNAKVMIPMIHSIEEIRWVKDQIAIVKAELDKAGIAYDASLPVGIMVEVPSVAFIIDQFCQEVDFFSIGSNDMTQYLLAVDRDNAQVASLYNSLSPAFLRMLDQVVSTAHQHGRWIGLCGELGADTHVLPLLVGAGLDEISMSTPKIAATKTALREMDFSQCQHLFEQACQCATIADVDTLLEQAQREQASKPLLDIECVFTEATFASKEEAIQALVGNLGVTGRANDIYKLEDDIWAREAVFSTGLGHGFAIPHTKSANIAHSSISIAKLSSPIDWQSDSGEVDFIIMLTLNHEQGDQHMRIFSSLARKLIHPSFRDSLKACDSGDAVIALLQQELPL